MPAKKSFKDYRKLIESKKDILSLGELIKLKLEIRESRLTETEKKSLIDGRISILILEQGTRKEAGRKEAEVRLAGLLKGKAINKELHKVLSDYLCIEAPETLYGSGVTYQRYVVPIIIKFIEFLSKREKKTLRVKDLDDTVISKTDITAYLVSVSKEEEERNKHRKILMTFRDWLFNTPYRVRLPYIESRKEEKPMQTTITRRKGRLLTLDEIEKILSAIKSIKAPSNEYYEIYYRLMLTSGLRPDHALVHRVEDVMGGEPITGCLGYGFVAIPTFEAVKKMKKQRGEWIHKKRPSDYIYIPLELRDFIDGYISKYKLDEKAKLIPVTYNSAKNEIDRLRKRLNISDLTLYCFRNTWVSVIYVLSGYNTDIVEELGGWRESKTILKHYKSTMKIDKAAAIFKKYKMYIPDEYEPAVKASLSGIEGMTDMEEEESIRNLEDTVKAQNKQIAWLVEEMKKLKKEL